MRNETQQSVVINRKSSADKYTVYKESISYDDSFKLYKFCFTDYSIRYTCTLAQVYNTMVINQYSAENCWVGNQVMQKLMMVIKINGKPANPGSVEKCQLKWCVCVRG